MKMTTPTIKLNSGYEMPVVGLGTWQMETQDVGKAVESAIKSGYKHLDCAWMYHNQKEIGTTLKKLFASGLKREDVFITSKVWNSFHSAEACKKHVLEILDQLQLDYIDLMLIHFPMGYAEGGEPIPRDDSGELQFSGEDYLTTYETLEDFVKEGKIRSIGVSNFNLNQLDRLLANCHIKPAVLQVEAHPYLPQKELRDFCKEKGIALVAYSCTSTRKPIKQVLDNFCNLNQYYMSFEYAYVLKQFGSLANPGSNEFREKDDPNILEDPKVNKIAEMHKKTPAQVVLRWAIQHGMLIIPKSVSKERISQNSDIFDFKLTDAEMKEIDGLESGYRVVRMGEGERKHPHCPF